MAIERSMKRKLCTPIQVPTRISRVRFDFGKVYNYGERYSKYVCNKFRWEFGHDLYLSITCVWKKIVYLQKRSAFITE